MTDRRKYILIVTAVAAAGFGYIKSAHRNIPLDLRDAVADKGFDTSMPFFEKDAANIQEPKAETVKGISKGYTAGKKPAAGASAKPVEWVVINGGEFTMGSNGGEKGFEDTAPTHEVTIKTFHISKTAVTVEQYAECVTKGECTEPGTGTYCNWGKTGRQLHPVNCVDWSQATQYAKFKGARLPSESEWEYAATSGGKNHKYPWGNDKPTCDKAVMDGNGGYGCGKNSTWPVCSKPAGNTAQGLCDMAGNVWQWVQDKYQDSYKGAPVDGGAFEGAGSGRVVRGGSFDSAAADFLRTDNRDAGDTGDRFDGFGFRLVRSGR